MADAQLRQRGAAAKPITVSAADGRAARANVRATITNDWARPADDISSAAEDAAWAETAAATLHASRTAAKRTDTQNAPARPGPRQPFDVLAVLFHAALFAATVYGVWTVPLQVRTAAWGIFYYLLCGFSYTAGYHRHYAHRSFQATWPLRLAFTLFGSGNFLGSVLHWCRNHRAHHRNADTNKIQRIGEADVSDLKASKLVTWQQRLYPLMAVAFGWVLPAAVAYSWNDWQGGLVYAGIVRTFLFLHGQYLLWALGHTFGHQPYSDNHSGMNNTFLSILSLGEGYLNFHREFPGDYRMGCFYYHMDATKWFLRLLSVLRLAYGFQKTPYRQILLVRVQRQLEELDRWQTHVHYGPAPESLPVWTMDDFDREVAGGRKLIIMDSIAHDVSEFLEEHPGGAEILLSKVGKDATIGFNGGVQRHSKAARNLAAMLRVAVVQGAAERRRDVKAKERRQQQQTSTSGTA